MTRRMQSWQHRCRCGKVIPKSTRACTNCRRADVESSPETFRAYRKRTMEGGSKMTEHNCPAPGCVTRVPREQLACRPHWYSIPKPLRDELWAAWDSGAGAGTSRHTTAVAACVEFLAKAA